MAMQEMEEEMIVKNVPVHCLVLQIGLWHASILFVFFRYHMMIIYLNLEVLVFIANQNDTQIC